MVQWLDIATLNFLFCDQWKFQVRVLTKFQCFLHINDEKNEVLCVFYTGVWGVGVATQKANLNQVPMGRDAHSLVLRHDGTIYHNNEEKNRLAANSLPQEGDIVVSIVVFVDSLVGEHMD